MPVESGQVVYEYSTAFGDEFNWRKPENYPVIQPSSLLLEEAMYAIRAEYIRIVQQQSGYQGGGLSPKPENSGWFVKYVNSNVTGLFDPSPSGGHLNGALPTFAGTAGSTSPGTFNAQYLKDMKNMFRAAVSYISETSSATPQEIMKHHLQNVKKYDDEYAESGFFFQEIADWSFSDQVGSAQEGPVYVNGYNRSRWTTDEYIDVMQEDNVYSGVWLTTRHIDELRIQPIPYITSTSGTVITVEANGGHDKSATKLWPVRPRYCRTDGTLSTGYSDLTIYGNCLISGMVIHMSGEGSVVEQGVYTPYTDGFTPHLPLSGSFSTNPMGSGWYAVFIGMSGTTPGIGLESGLFPWGTAVDETTPQIAYWPRMMHPPVPDFDDYFGPGDVDLFVTSPENNKADGSDGYGNFGFLVTDKMWAIQEHLSKQFSNNNRQPKESGITWYAPHPVPEVADLLEVDMYDGSETSTGPGDAGRTWWGTEYEGLLTDTSPNQYWHGGGYSFYSTNGTIIRGHASGSSSSLPGNGFSNGNEGVWITEWTLPLHSPSFNAVTSGSQTIGGVAYSLRPVNMTSITHDGTRFVCAGDVARMSGVAPEALEETTDHSYYVNDSSYTVTNVTWTTGQAGDIPGGDSQHTDISARLMSYYYDNGNSEILGANQPDWSSSAIGGAYSGLYAVVTFDFTSPFTTMSGQELRTWYTSTYGSGVGVGGLAANVVDTTSVRITHFFEDEDDNQLYAYYMAEPSGGSVFLNRYLSRLDTDGGHPYEMRETYLVGREANASNQAINLNRSQFSNFITGFNY